MSMGARNGPGGVICGPNAPLLLAIVLWVMVSLLPLSWIPA
jgi:hypothetical protein